MPAVLSKPEKPLLPKMPETSEQFACLTPGEKQALLSKIHTMDRRSGHTGLLTVNMGRFMEGATPVAPNGWGLRPSGNWIIGKHNASTGLPKKKTLEEEMKE